VRDQVFEILAEVERLASDLMRVYTLLSGPKRFDELLDTIGGIKCALTLSANFCSIYSPTRITSESNYIDVQPTTRIGPVARVKGVPPFIGPTRIHADLADELA
jgi:hypothetical protein